MGRNNAPMSRGGMSRAGLGTAMGGGGGGEARPMTSVSGAGYKGNLSKEQKAFDPLNMGVGRGPAPPLAEKSDNSPEDKAKEMEKKVTVRTIFYPSIYFLLCVCMCVCLTFYLTFRFSRSGASID